MLTTQKAIFVSALISSVCHAEMSQEQNLTNENVEYPSICRNGIILGEADGLIDVRQRASPNQIVKNVLRVVGTYDLY